MTLGYETALLTAERVLNAEALAAAVAMRTEGEGSEDVTEAGVIAELVSIQEGAVKLVRHHGDPDAAIPDPVEALARLFRRALARQLEGRLLLLYLLLAGVRARPLHSRAVLD